METPILKIDIKELPIIVQLVSNLVSLFRPEPSGRAELTFSNATLKFRSRALSRNFFGQTNNEKREYVIKPNKERTGIFLNKKETY